MGKLTSARAEKIKYAVNQTCEIPRCKNKAHDIHHIRPRKEGGDDIPSNLIVLCANHHRDAHDGKITRTKLTERVKKRRGALKKEMQHILRERKTTKDKKEEEEETIEDYIKRVRNLGLYGTGKPFK